MPPDAPSLLIVDDNPADRALLRYFLTPHGFDLYDAGSGAEALARLDQSSFDLVLLDVEMPGGNGMDALRAIRARFGPAELPVMMATVLDSSGQIVEALRLGANDYVTKPFDLPVVLARARTQCSLKFALDRARELEQRLAQHNADLAQANHRMCLELAAAAQVQESLLPSALPVVGGAEFAWYYRPCTELAGDLLGLVGLGNGRVCLYVLDVVDHGVAAALLAVMINQALSRLLLSGDAPTPAAIAAQLNREFPWNQQTQQFFTLMLGILDRPAGEFRFVSAGQPGPIHLRHGGLCLDSYPGLPIGLGDGVYEEHRIELAAGDRLYLYTDGLTETHNPEGKQLGDERCAALLAAARDLPLQDGLNRLVRLVDEWIAPNAARDDISIVAVEIT